AGGDEKKSILAGCFEAVVAAIYLDGGIESASALIASIFSEIIEFISIPQKQVDYKTRLQEYAQLHYKTIPIYEVTGENGPAHDRSFTVAMTLKPGITTEGYGKSKKKAEQDAAEKCLRLLNELPVSS
ncbi:MAG: putative dsRNA-binding protein, partial [Pseudomonadota bacterium]